MAIVTIVIKNTYVISYFSINNLYRNDRNNGDLEGYERKDSFEELKQSSEFLVDEAKKINGNCSNSKIILR